MLRRLSLLAGVLLVGFSTAVHATEGALGRPITGQQLAPKAGIVPPGPGWAVSVSTIYFNGDIGGSRQVPIAGQVSGGIEPTASYTIANLTRIWDTHIAGWNFASSVGVPLQYVKVQTNLLVGGNSSGREESSTGIADMLFTPIAAGKHFSEADHMSLSLPIYAPSASYDSKNLANDGQNTWTFMPTVAYTHLGHDGSEFSAMGMLQFYTKNSDTNYRNAPLLVAEALWTTPVGSGIGVGVVGGLIYQLSDDKGPTADRLNGFKGSAIGAGPMLTWSGKIRGVTTSVSARWVFDIAADKRPKGNSLGLSISLLLP